MFVGDVVAVGAPAVVGAAVVVDVAVRFRFTVPPIFALAAARFLFCCCHNDGNNDSDGDACVIDIFGFFHLEMVAMLELMSASNEFEREKCARS